jgi:hypothetical protein
VSAMTASSFEGRRSRDLQQQENHEALGHAVRLITRICHIAGSPTLIEDARESLTAEGIRSAIRSRDTAILFDWIVAALSYQGIADRVAEDYMERYGQASWRVIESDLRCRPICPKLKSYWHFHGCGYMKSRYTCAEPDHLARCPLPNHWLRNGRLNQTAFALHLFIRDIANGDLVDWIDRRLQTAAKSGPERLAKMRAALLDPLRQVYGVSDKVLAMALSQLFLGAPRYRRRWIEVGASMIAVDTLVHNFLHRTGVLRRFRADHPHGVACYRPGGCAEIIEMIAERIDAKQINGRFPSKFPRFIQHAIWRYCAQQGLDICNGNKIDDRKRCTNKSCQLYSICDRRQLLKASKNEKNIVI